MIINDVSILNECLKDTCVGIEKPHATKISRSTLGRLLLNACLQRVSYRKLWWLDGKTHITMELKNAIYHKKLRRDENSIKHRARSLCKHCSKWIGLTINSEFIFIFWLGPKCFGMLFILWFESVLRIVMCNGFFMHSRNTNTHNAKRFMF